MTFPKTTKNYKACVDAEGIAHEFVHVWKRTEDGNLQRVTECTNCRATLRDFSWNGVLVAEMSKRRVDAAIGFINGPQVRGLLTERKWRPVLEARRNVDEVDVAIEAGRIVCAACRRAHASVASAVACCRDTPVELAPPTGTARIAASGTPGGGGGAVAGGFMRLDMKPIVAPPLPPVGGLGGAEERVVTGANLDAVGRLHGLERTRGESDAVFRERLLARLRWAPLPPPPPAPKCRFKGCGMPALVTFDAALAYRRGHLCASHAASAEFIEGGRGLPPLPRVVTCDVGADWEV